MSCAAPKRVVSTTKQPSNAKSVIMTWIAPTYARLLSQDTSKIKQYSKADKNCEPEANNENPLKKYLPSFPNKGSSAVNFLKWIAGIFTSGKEKK